MSTGGYVTCQNSATLATGEVSEQNREWLFTSFNMHICRFYNKPLVRVFHGERRAQAMKHIKEGRRITVEIIVSPEKTAGQRS